MKYNMKGNIIMKYTVPSYLRENVETVDIMETSPVNVAYVNKNVPVLDEEGNPTGQFENVTTTQVTVDFGSLTQQY